MINSIFRNSKSHNICFILLILMILMSSVVSYAAPEPVASIEKPGNRITFLTLTASPGAFSVTVPTTLPVSVSSDGTITTASSVKITNNSVAPVMISEAAVEPKNSWSLVSFDTDFKAKQVDLKEFGLKINSTDTYSNANDIADTFESINGQDELTFSYDATVAAQSSAVTEVMGNVVFTVEWAKKTLISFTINDVSYQAEKEMTWAEWLESDYASSFDSEDAGPYDYWAMHYLEYNGDYVYSTDKIIADATYTYPTWAHLG